MKTSTQWQTLSRDQKQAWQQWAKNNPVFLDSGELRRVSAPKAFTIILTNRALAGAAANKGTPPTAVMWLSGALSTESAGPFTDNEGYMGFRATDDLPQPTKWFVWASRPVAADETAPLATLQFIKFLPLDPMAVDDPTLGFQADYRTVHGSFNGPGENGDWGEDERYIWFRVQQYHEGQLGPALILKGRIQVEL